MNFDLVGRLGLDFTEYYSSWHK